MRKTKSFLSVSLPSSDASPQSFFFFLLDCCRGYQYVCLPVVNSAYRILTVMFTANSIEKKCHCCTTSSWVSQPCPTQQWISVDSNHESPYCGSLISSHQPSPHFSSVFFPPPSTVSVKRCRIKWKSYKVFTNKAV